MTQRLYCVWRVDGEFSITDIDVSFRDKDFNTIVKEAIRKDADDMGMSAFLNKEDKKQHINDLIAIATDSDHPAFIGYEMPMVIVADPETIEFIGA
ncbi:hypothetical protein [Silicibacter phage DSS3phi2]|uniref:Uncharacterized protein n=5 Tax=Aorunvirus V12 TaxID=2846074 RepID=A0A2Z4QFE0_9CAUD|nr:hypothetical protein DSS3P2_gp26 [Silicibacter phage DSS3phi2]YP_009880430.1 hypothetical protein HYP62_gp27 [Ruegeria phage vB_RpoP-V12]AWY08985.1 hypothetical protein vBRpoPV21_27 [Ruegeria phage vB_RpoP-V21]AWY09546.1 hypothetical protein vBRpoPV17_27 [Ruegeria phage vB_RpoP-V17]AXF42147.1 hypothetical protein vBRpoPV14_29 [Ruegeria phage vB_RpoP-V14]ACL81294.1 hypothetical protein [Silicibacter phage DSS3phi2]AWY08814.1 hypothetical protein vBRpoPV12_27 [Ruegeria phage vB_RpoP-V12]